MVCLLVSFAGVASAAPVSDVPIYKPSVGRSLTDNGVDDWVRSLPPQARGEFGRWVAENRELYRGRGYEFALFVFSSRAEFDEFLNTSNPEFAKAMAATASQRPCPVVTDSSEVAVLGAVYHDPATGQAVAGAAADLIWGIVGNFIYDLLVHIWHAFIDAQGNITWVGPAYSCSVTCPYCGVNGRLTVLSQSPYSAWIGCLCGEQFQVAP